MTEEKKKPVVKPISWLERILMSIRPRADRRHGRRRRVALKLLSIGSSGNN